MQSSIAFVLFFRVLITIAMCDYTVTTVSESRRFSKTSGSVTTMATTALESGSRPFMMTPGSTTTMATAHPSSVADSSSVAAGATSLITSGVQYGYWEYTCDRLEYRYPGWLIGRCKNKNGNDVTSKLYLARCMGWNKDTGDVYWEPE